MTRVRSVLAAAAAAAVAIKTNRQTDRLSVCPSLCLSPTLRRSVSLSVRYLFRKMCRGHFGGVRDYLGVMLDALLKELNGKTIHKAATHCKNLLQII